MKNRIIKQFKDDWPDYIWQLVLFIIVGTIIGIIITNILTPKTDIELKCEVQGESLLIKFNNKADFAGKNFYVYINNLESQGFGTTLSTSEQCRHISGGGGVYKIYCDFIPPNTELKMMVGPVINKEILSKNIMVEWWGETTPYKVEYCKG